MISPSPKKRGKKKKPRKQFGQVFLSGVLGGMLAGFILGIFTWFYHGSTTDAGLDFVSVSGVLGFITTVSYFSLGHAILGAVFGFIIAVLAALVRKTPPRFLSASVAFAISFALFIFIYFFVVKNLSLPSSLPLKDPMRSAITTSCVLIGLLSLVAAFAISIPIFIQLRFKNFRDVLIGILVVTAVISVVRVVGLNTANARYEDHDLATWTMPDNAKKVIVIGLDGASWQLLDEFSEEGLLPTFDRLKNAGIYGNLVTHGRRTSPAIWTGVATGRCHKEHGIIGFTIPMTGTAKSRVWWSTDRKKPALWQITEEFEKTAVVINWWASYPAEKTNGVIISRIVEMDSASVYPGESLPEIKALVDSSYQTTKDRTHNAVAEVNTIFNLAEKYVENDQPDLLMFYIKRTDNLQHIYWAAHEPEVFDASWQITEEYIAEGRQSLRSVWGEVDKRLGQFMSLVDEETVVLIISDHGFRPRAVFDVLPKTNDLLRAMGYLEWADDQGKVIDLSRTIAFAGVNEAWNPYIGVYVNTIGRQAQGIIMPDSAQVVARRLADELASLKVKETGEPLYRSVGLVSEHRPTRLRHPNADVYLEKERALRVIGKDRTVMVGGVQRDLNDFLMIRRTVMSGNHDPRGVFLCVGPSFQNKVILPLVAESPYTRALTYVTGYKSYLEGLYDLLRQLGFLDPYTTIDVAPTVLYLMGLPASAEMEGKLMEGILQQRLLEQQPAGLVQSYDYLHATARSDVEATPSDAEVERLRALGYIH